MYLIMISLYSKLGYLESIEGNLVFLTFVYQKILWAILTPSLHNADFFCFLIEGLR